MQLILYFADFYLYRNKVTHLNIFNYAIGLLNFNSALENIPVKERRVNSHPVYLENILFQYR